MKIYIIGAGAIGKALAVNLTLEGTEVEVIRGSLDDGKFYKEEISLQISNETAITSEIKINSLCNFKELNGLIVFANKSFGNKNLAKKIKEKAGNSPIVILQNGLGIEKPFIDAGFKDLFRSVLFSASQINPENKNEIRYKAIAQSQIGTIKQNQYQLKEIVKELNTANFSFIAEKEIQKSIWKKTISNCVLNSICPLLDTDNGIFYRDENAFLIAKRIIKECISISKAKGIQLEALEVEKQVFQMSKMSNGQYSSTSQDISNKKKTEIDTLNFEVYRIAKELDLTDQVQETKLLGDLILIKSDLKK